MRFTSVPLLASILLLAACGGGGGSSSSNGGGGGGSTGRPQVTMALGSNSAIIPSGLGPTLRWHTSGTACSASGGWSGAKAASGSETLTGLTRTTSYSLTCTADNAPSA